MVAAGLGGRRVPEDALGRGRGRGAGRRQPLPRLLRLLHLVWGRPRAPERTEPRNVLVGTRVENEAGTEGQRGSACGSRGCRSRSRRITEPVASVSAAAGLALSNALGGWGAPPCIFGGRAAAGNPGCWALRGIRLSLLAPHPSVRLRAGLLLGTLRPGLRLTLIQCLPPLQSGPIRGHQGLERRHTGASRRRRGFGSRPLPCSKWHGKARLRHVGKFCVSRTAVSPVRDGLIYANRARLT